MNEQERIAKALDYAMRWGQVEGDHHRLWVIDQMVRALCNCQIQQYNITYQGKSYQYEEQGTNESYNSFVRIYNEGEHGEGEHGYSWKTGIAP